MIGRRYVLQLRRPRRLPPCRWLSAVETFDFSSSRSPPHLVACAHAASSCDSESYAARFKSVVWICAKKILSYLHIIMFLPRLLIGFTAASGLPHAAASLLHQSSMVSSREMSSAGASSSTHVPSKKRAAPRALKHKTKREVQDTARMAHGTSPLDIALLAGGKSNAAALYNDEPLLNQHGRMDPRRTELVRLLRRHNYSLPNIVGQTIEAQILRVGKDSIFVDPGFYSIR